MRLLYLTLQGMRSFRQRQEIDFENLPHGLYYVTGRNLVEPELAANGVGKSSLFESLFWLFYGKTPRNLRAGAVRSWGQRGPCQVEAMIAFPDKARLLQRSWGPNSLTIETETQAAVAVDQQKFDELIGLSPEAFLTSILFAQFTPSFVDLTNADRMTLYSTVMALEQWEGYAATASNATAQLKDSVQALEIKLARLDSEHQILNDTALLQAEREWGKEQARKVSELRAALKTAEARAAELRKHHTVVPQEKLTFVRKQIEGVTGAVAKTQALLQVTENDLHKIETARKQLRCPTCGAPWKVSNIDAPASYHKAIHLHKTQLKRAETDLTKLQLEYNALEKAAGASRTVQADLDRTEATLPPIRSQLDATQRESNPHTAAVKRNAKRKIEIETELKAAKAELTETQQVIESTSFWVKGFKDVRLFLIEESLVQLNAEVNECLYQLGLQDWAIQFVIEQETKSGTVKRGFQCMVRSPGSVEDAPWEAWSGGETQRLRLAVNMGMANLICERTGVTPNVEFWDEPTTGMSEPGIAALLELLKERSERTKKIIMLADHRALDFGGFDGIITIEKGKDGSQIIQT